MLSCYRHHSYTRYFRNWGPCSKQSPGLLLSAYFSLGAPKAKRINNVSCRSASEKIKQVNDQSIIDRMLKEDLSGEFIFKQRLKWSECSFVFFSDLKSPSPPHGHEDIPLVFKKYFCFVQLGLELTCKCLCIA